MAPERIEATFSFGGCDPYESERAQAEEYSHAPEVGGHPRPHDDIGKRQLLNPLWLLAVVPTTKRDCSLGPPGARDPDTTEHHGHDKRSRGHHHFLISILR
jgi:hypothetical protein